MDAEDFESLFVIGVALKAGLIIVIKMIIMKYIHNKLIEKCFTEQLHSFITNDMYSPNEVYFYNAQTHHSCYIFSFALKPE